MSISDLVGIWGGVVSTILLFFTLIQAWANRSRIEVDYIFTGDALEGNLVKIRNISSDPIIISYWELICKSKDGLRWKQDWTIDSDPSFEDDIKINAHSQYTLIFNEGDHFDWKDKPKKIYLRSCIAGRKKPLLKKVYG